MRDKMNINILKKQEIISDTIVGFLWTLNRLDRSTMIKHVDFVKLRTYWEKQLNATDEDLYKTNGPIRAPEQTR